MDDVDRYGDQVFRPWGNVAVMVLSIALIAAAVIDARRRGRRGDVAWTPNHKIGVLAMSFVVLGQVLTLL